MSGTFGRMVGVLVLASAPGPVAADGDLVGPPDPHAVVRERMGCARRFVAPPESIERLMTGIPERVVREAVGRPTRVAPCENGRVVWFYLVGDGPGYQQWLGVVFFNGRVEYSTASRVAVMPGIGLSF